MWLVIIGAINIGLGALGWDVLNLIFGSISWLAMLVDILIGLSGLYMLWGVFKG